MRWIGIDDASLDCIGQYSTKKSDGARCCARSTSHDSATAKLSRLDAAAGLAGHDVLQGLRDVRFHQILDPVRTKQRNDVALDAPRVGENGAGFLGAPALSKNEAGFKIGDVKVTQFLNGNRLAVELLLFGRVVALSDPAQLDLRLLASALWCPDSVQSDCEATRPLAEPVLDDIAALAGCEYSEAKAGQFVVPNDVIFRATVRGVDDPFRELRHGLPPTLAFPLA